MNAPHWKLWPTRTDVFLVKMKSVGYQKITKTKTMDRYEHGLIDLAVTLSHCVTVLCGLCCRLISMIQ